MLKSQSKSNYPLKVPFTQSDQVGLSIFHVDTIGPPMLINGCPFTTYSDQVKKKKQQRSILPVLIMLD